MAKNKAKDVFIQPSSDLGKQPAGETHLLVIAIDDYQKAPLANCKNDAERLSELLVDQYGFDPRKVRKLYDKEANHAEVDKTLREYRQVIQDKDNFLVFFSGHGVNEEGVHFLVMYDKAPDFRGVLYPVSTFKKRLEAISSFHTVVILDCCFSGGLFRQSTRDYLDLDIDAYRHPSRWGIAASHTRQKAYDGTPGENSPFSASLISALKKNENPLGIQQLGASIEKLVAQKTRNQKKQTTICRPLDMEGDDLGQFVFYPHVKNLSEDEYWMNCREENTFEAYRAYDDKFPKGKYAKEAWKYMTMIKDGRTPPTILESYTDSRDGQTYRTVELNGLLWMAENLNYNIGKGCWFYDEDPENGKKHGRLYTWEAAKAACPPGWRLPTDEDWKALRKSFGSAIKAYRALIKGGNSGFDALLGGWRYSQGRFNNLDTDGYFWSTTERDSDYAWGYTLGRSIRELSRGSYSKLWGLSCRCVQDGGPNSVDL